jgi:hypothetical protein
MNSSYAILFRNNDKKKVYIFSTDEIFSDLGLVESTDTESSLYK